MYKFLLIEDSAEDSRLFQDTVKRMNLEAKEELYEVDVASTYASGLSMIANDFNGVIVDIKLDGEHSGNEIIREIMQKYRLPVAIFTGTPDTEQAANSPIMVYKKGEAQQTDIIANLRSISDTGLFNVIGGTGIIETVMNKVFWNNLFPQIGLWKAKKESGIDTEKVLLRYSISHIHELIDNEVTQYVTEEMYICPPINSKIKTGSIIQAKRDGLFCIVLSPPCDLAVHNGKIKTDRIQVCEIESQDEINMAIVSDIISPAKQAKQIAIALNNNYTDYYHWLPNNTLFAGGYINFRKVITYSEEQLRDQFSDPLLKVQECFVKSILGRFSAYYARQGQPDFNFSAEADEIVRKLTATV